MRMKRVTVRTPATSANLGPGFDCFGCAFDFYNTQSDMMSTCIARW